MAALLPKTWKYVWATAVVTAASLALFLIHPQVNLTTASLILVLTVMLTAVRWGSGPALLGSLIAVGFFDYYFVPPVGWEITDPEDWIALLSFLMTAIVVGQLSSRAQRKADEAEARRQEVEELYGELQRTFDKASEAATLRKSERLKTALLDAVTHDLRTPLTSIKGAATTLLQERTSDEVRRELLKVIDEESDRLNRFVEEMMELAQIEGGQLLLRRVPTSAQEIVGAALDRAAAALARHIVDLNVPETLPLVQVDPPLISGVVYELLENAARYSPAETHIAVEARQREPQWVEVAVADQGCGIRPEHRDRIFEKFFRAGRGETTDHGFGVGLAIARGIVEAHGGRIWAEANNGSGSVVRFTVPCEVREIKDV
jgi:two-component system sensor histidine kinase KdpD